MIMMNNVIEIIKDLEGTNSSKVKFDILNQHKDNITLKRVMELTYNPFLKYGLTEKALINMEPSQDRVTTFSDIESIALKLSKSNINNKLREEVSRIVSDMGNDEYRDLAKKILFKDLRCGVSRTTINKVWPNLIPTFDVQAGISLDKAKFKKDEEIWITEKFDGIRCVCICKNEDIQFFSRSGKEILGLEDLKEDIRKFLYINNCLLEDNIVLDGELLKINPNNLNSGDLYRETVSIVNSKSVDKKDINLQVFDIISYEDFVNGKSKDDYKTRRGLLDSFIQYGYVKIAPILYHGTNHGKIQELLVYMDTHGKEGIMVNKNDFYVTKRTKSLIKCKVFMTADVRVVDFLEGTGRNKNKLGKITIEFEHEGKIYTCNVGSGFDDDERERFWNDRSLLMNKIVEISYLEISKDKSGEYSLRLATWTHRIREDKTEISMN